MLNLLGSAFFVFVIFLGVFWSLFIVRLFSAAQTSVDRSRRAALYYKRAFIIDHLPQSIRDRLPGRGIDYTLLPSTFEEQRNAGFSSSAFDLEANNSEDTRAGLDDVRLPLSNATGCIDLTLSMHSVNSRRSGIS